MRRLGVLLCAMVLLTSCDALPDASLRPAGEPALRSVEPPAAAVDRVSIPEPRRPRPQGKAGRRDVEKFIRYYLEDLYPYTLRTGFLTLIGQAGYGPCDKCEEVRDRAQELLRDRLIVDMTDPVVESIARGRLSSLKPQYRDTFRPWIVEWRVDRVEITDEAGEVVKREDDLEYRDVLLVGVNRSYIWLSDWVSLIPTAAV